MLTLTCSDADAGHLSLPQQAPAWAALSTDKDIRYPTRDGLILPGLGNFAIFTQRHANLLTDPHYFAEQLCNGCFMLQCFAGAR